MKNKIIGAVRRTATRNPLDSKAGVASDRASTEYEKNGNTRKHQRYQNFAVDRAKVDHPHTVSQFGPKGKLPTKKTDEDLDETTLKQLVKTTSRKLDPTIKSRTYNKGEEKARSGIKSGDAKSIHQGTRLMGVGVKEEELDELSKGTLGSYVKKAELGRRSHSMKSVDHYSNDDVHGAVHHTLKAVKREKGIDKATTKLNKEEAQVVKKMAEGNKMKAKDIWDRQVGVNESADRWHGEGHKAHGAGKKRADNPYKEGTPAARNWAQGYTKASDGKEPEKFVGKNVKESSEHPTKKGYTYDPELSDKHVAGFSNIHGDQAHVKRHQLPKDHPEAKRDSVKESSGIGYYFIQGGLARSKGQPGMPSNQEIQDFIQTHRTAIVHIKHKVGGQPATVIKTIDINAGKNGKSALMSKHRAADFTMETMRSSKEVEVESVGMNTSKPYGVRYKVFAGREGRVTTKEAWFATEQQLQRAVERIENLGNFYEIDGYSHPGAK